MASFSKVGHLGQSNLAAAGRSVASRPHPTAGPRAQLPKAQCPVGRVQRFSIMSSRREGRPSASWGYEETPRLFRVLPQGGGSRPCRRFRSPAFEVITEATVSVKAFLQQLPDRRRSVARSSWDSTASSCLPRSVSRTPARQAVAQIEPLPIPPGHLR